MRKAFQKNLVFLHQTQQIRASILKEGKVHSRGGGGVAFAFKVETRIFYVR